MIRELKFATSRPILAAMFTTLHFVFAGCSSKVGIDGDAAVSDLDKIIITSEQAEEVGLVLGEPVQTLLPVYLTVNGYLDLPPQNRMFVAPPIRGEILEILVLEGQQVARNEVIARIGGYEILELQEEYLTLVSQEDLLKKEYQRQAVLRQEDVNTEQILAESEADFRMTAARLMTTRKQLELANINPEFVEKGNLTTAFDLKAPFDGVITEINASRGEYLDPGEAIFEVIDPSHLHLELRVFERDAGLIEVGQSLEFNVPALDSKARKGQVYLVNKELDETRSLIVHAHIEESDSKLIPGLYAEARVEVESRNCIAVPTSAVSKDADVSVVFALESQEERSFVFEPVVIALGIVTDEWTEVITPLHDSTEIVVNGTQFLAQSRR